MAANDSGSNIQQRHPNCLKCIYHKVTWHPSFPNACIVFKIKSRYMPSSEVFQSTGKNCPSFKLKEGLK